MVQPSTTWVNLSGVQVLRVVYADHLHLQFRKETPSGRVMADASRPGPRWIANRLNVNMPKASQRTSGTRGWVDLIHCFRLLPDKCKNGGDTRIPCR